MTRTLWMWCLLMQLELMTVSNAANMICSCSNVVVVVVIVVGVVVVVT